MKAQINKYRHHLGQNGMDEKLREELILEYAPFVKYIAERMAMRLPPSISKEELISAGIIGLFDAIDKFDPDMGIRFRTYAEHRIRGAILDDLRKMDWVSRSDRKNVQRIESAMNALQNRLGREPEDHEVAREMSMDIESYHKILQRAQGVGLLSLDEPVQDGTGSKLARQASDDPSPLDVLNVKELKRAVARVLTTLKKKEQTVMSLYYYEELTLREIAEVLGLTESRISQIHSKAIIKLRAKLRDYYTA